MRKLWDQVRNLITGVNFILQILRRQLWLSTASFSIAFGTADKIRNQEKDKIHSSMTPRPASQRLQAGKRLLIYNINTARKDLRSDPIRAIDIWNEWKWIQALIKNTRAFLTEPHFIYVTYNAEIRFWGEIGDGIFTLTIFHKQSFSKSSTTREAVTRTWQPHACDVCWGETIKNEQLVCWGSLRPRVSERLDKTNEAVQLPYFTQLVKMSRGNHDLSPIFQGYHAVEKTICRHPPPQ